MPLSPNQPTDTASLDGERSQIRLLDLALPVPEDGGERVRALSYLNESVNHYINQFCDPQDIHGRQITGALDALVTAARKDGYNGVSLTQATQVLLCFSICLFI